MITAHLHANMIAGCIPASARPAFDADAVAAIAGRALHDHRLHVLTAVDGGYLYYFALASKWVTHAPTFDTVLAIALPGHPQHRGDGIYLHAAAPGVAAIKRQGELLLIGDDDATLEGIARAYGLGTHRIDAATTPWPLVAADDARRESISRMTGRIATVCRRAIGACVALYVVMALADAVLDQLASDTVPVAATAALVKRIQYVSPLSEQLAQIQKMSATVVRAGGWIEGYVWKQGKGEAFSITLPGWVSQDYIESLGPGTVTEQNVPDNLIIARKGDLENMGKR